MIRALVVDDEVHAREDLARLLAETGSVQVVGTCGNALEALRAIRATRPDVLFLDVQMPEVNGLQLLSMIDEDLVPFVVFVTAYDEYALDAFDRDALDYVLKPVQPDRLARAIEKVARLVDAGRRPPHPGPPIERIPCLSQRNIKIVDVADVEFVRSGTAGVYVMTAGGEFFTELTLRVLEDRAPRLVRCHKQHLVNLALIDEIVPEGPEGPLVRTRSGREIPVSRRLLLRLKDAFGIRHRQSRS